MTGLEEMKWNKRIFDFCKENEGDLPSMHIIDVTDEGQIDDGIQEFRIYHSKRYCIEISKEPVERIDGYYYSFSSDTWEDYEPINFAEVNKLLGLLGS